MDTQKSLPDIPPSVTSIDDLPATTTQPTKMKTLHKTFSFEEHTCSLAIKMSPRLIYHRTTSTAYLKPSADLVSVRRERERSATMDTYKPLPTPPPAPNEISFVCTISLCHGGTIDTNTNFLASGRTLLERKTIMTTAAHTDYISAMGMVEAEAARIFSPLPADSKPWAKSLEHSVIDIRTLWRHECLVPAGVKGGAKAGVPLDAENWRNAMIMLGKGRWEVKVVFFEKEAEGRGQSSKGAKCVVM